MQENIEVDVDIGTRITVNNIDTFFSIEMDLVAIHTRDDTITLLKVNL